MNYYIINKERGCVGNCVLFWRQGGHGYTTNMDDAQMFSEDESADLIKDRDKFSRILVNDAQQKKL